MATDYAECPAYKSKTYYGVVVHNKKYNGWACIFAGDGAMKFRHDNGGKLDFYHGRHEGLDGGPWDNWMSRCWADFLAMAERHNVQGDRRCVALSRSVQRAKRTGSTAGLAGCFDGEK